MPFAKRNISPKPIRKCGRLTVNQFCIFSVWQGHLPNPLQMQKNFPLIRFCLLPRIRPVPFDFGGADRKQEENGEERCGKGEKRYFTIVHPKQENGL